jgi:hypothetical protein
MDSIVAAIAAERAIVERLYRCCRAIDAIDASSWTDCFTPDAVVTTRGPDGSVVRTLRGRQELTQFVGSLAEGVRPGAQLHVLSNPIVELEGTGAVASSCWTLITAGAGETSVMAAGTYVDHFTPDAGGSWRIAERVVSPVGDR